MRVLEVNVTIVSRGHITPTIQSNQSIKQLSFLHLKENNYSLNITKLENFFYFVTTKKSTVVAKKNVIL